jgi:hypothetical protein
MNDMKKIVAASIISLLFIGVGMTIVVPSVQGSPAIMIQQYQLYPEVLMPGDSAILTLVVMNGEAVATQTTTSGSGGESTTTIHTLGATLDSISISPVSSHGQQIYATTRYQDVGYLAAGASIPVNFKLQVDSNMSEGVYFPTAEIDVDGGTDVSYPLMMKVSNSTIALLQKSIPSQISKGGATDLIVTVVNTRENAVNEVVITPSGTDVEFIPSSYFIGALPAKTSMDVTFSIKPLGLGSQTLSFDVTFKNGDNLHTSTLNVPVTIIETLDVAPIITNFPLSITKGGSSLISVEVYNAKAEQITGVLITPICDATVIPSQYFIGAMDPDDVFSASFNIYTDTVDLGSHTIGFKVSFKQGNDYFETPLVSKTFDVITGKGVSYQVSGSSSSQSSGTNSGGALTSSLLTCLTPLIIVIVFIIIGVLLYLRWKKRRQT